MTTVDALRQAYDSQTRLWVPAHPAADYRYEQLGPVLRVVGQYRGFIDPAPDLGLEGAELDALIAEQRDFFAARGEGVEWKTRGHDRPADLAAHLLAAGFRPEPQETVMIGRSDELAAEPVLPAGVTLRAVGERADFERIAAMESEVWGDDWSWLADDLAARIRAAPDDIAIFVAEAQGRVVAAAWLVVKPATEFAGLWAGSTLKAFRGRGIYRALVARRAQLAVAHGIRYLQVDASDESRPILLRLGFQAVTTTTPYVYLPASH